MGVEEGSTEPVQADAQVYRHETNRGIAAALNTGVKATRTEWWCWLSSDDVFYPGKVARQLEAKSPCSFHRYDVLGQDGETIGCSPAVTRWQTVTEQRQALAVNCWVNGSTVMIHRDVLLDVGLFDERLRYAQDWEMWNRIGRKYLWRFIPEVLGARREHGNLTARIDANPGMRAERDAEDRQIHATYQPFGRPSGKRKS